jgi:tellurite resistance protein TerC
VIIKTLHLTFKAARRIAVAVLGITVIAIGIVMIVTPGPAIVVIPVGLAILGVEFAWARNWLRRLRQVISDRNFKRRTARATSHHERTVA